MPKTRVRDLVVFLPGITGSVLAKDGHDVWAISAGSLWAALRSRGGSLRDLVLEDDDPELPVAPDGVTAPRLIKGPHLAPGLAKIDGYAPVVEAILAKFDVVPAVEGSDAPANFIEFPYDWRRDNRAAARLLADTVNTRLDAWKRATGVPDPKVILIGHSMGGLIARHYLEVMGGWERCRALITYGTPYRGSLNALSFLADGFRKFGLDLSDVLRSCPSVYQLLPIYPCVTDGQTWARVSECSIDGVDRQRAAEALQFHRDIEAAVGRRGGLGDGRVVIPVVGTEQPTNQYAVRRGSRVEISRENPDWMDENLGGGDGTVPRVSAVPIELSDEGGHVYICERHSALHSHPAARNDLVARLQATQASGWRAIRGPDVVPSLERSSLAVDVEDALDVGQPLHVWAKLIGPAETGLYADIRPADDRAAAPTEAVLEPQADGSHHAQITGLSPGIYRVTVRSRAAGPTAPLDVTDVVAVLD